MSRIAIAAVACATILSACAPQMDVVSSRGLNHALYVPSSADLAGIDWSE